MSAEQGSLFGPPPGNEEPHSAEQKRFEEARPVKLGPPDPAPGDSDPGPPTYCVHCKLPARSTLTVCGAQPVICCGMPACVEALGG